MNCECGAEMTKRMSTEKDPYHYSFSGIPNVFLRGIAIFHCPVCKSQVPRIPKLEELHRLIAMTLLKKTGRLLGREIRFLRKNIGIPANQIARILGMTPENYSRVENEKNQGLGEPAERLFRLMAKAETGGGSVREAILELARILEFEDRRKTRPLVVRTFKLARSGTWKAEAA
jgi:transcriptional regulator with XRE-family HTH domain